MKYSEALRKATTIFTPQPAISKLWFAGNGEACAVSAIIFMLSGLELNKNNINIIKNKMCRFNGDFEEFIKLTCEEIQLPIPFEEFKFSLNEMMEIAENNYRWSDKSKLKIFVVVIVLNDMLGWEWNKIADWLESIGQ